MVYQMKINYLSYDIPPKSEFNHLGGQLGEMNFSAKTDSLDNSQTATDVLCWLLRQQAAPGIDMKVFDSDLLNFKYFVLILREVVETKLEDPRERLKQSIKYSSGEAKHLVKNYIYFFIRRIQRSHEDTATYRKKIKELPAVKVSDAAGLRRFFNFLVKCKSLLPENKMNTIINNSGMHAFIYKTGRIESDINSDAQMNGNQSL